MPQHIRFPNPSIDRILFQIPFTILDSRKNLHLLSLSLSVDASFDFSTFHRFDQFTQISVSYTNE